MKVQNGEESFEEFGKAAKLASDIPENVTDVLNETKTLQKNVANRDISWTKNMSFLDVKNQTLLSYIINLSSIIMRKFSGKKIEDCKAIERLVELRTVLEKMKPVHERLKYQINKLLSVAASGNIDKKDPLRYRANPDNLDSKDDAKSQSEGTRAYVPPKISAVPYDGDDSTLKREKILLEKAQRRALSSSIIQELRKEYDIGPEEIRESGNPHRKKINRELEQITRYEEDNMLRMPLAKRQKHSLRQVSTLTTFSTKFDDISALDLGVDDMSMLKKGTTNKKSEKRSSKGMGKKKSKGKKKATKRKRQ